MKKILPLIAMSIKQLARGIVILCISLNPIFANTSKAQVKSIDEVFLKIEKQPKTLVQFFNEIEKKTEFKFFYTREAIQSESVISYLKDSESVEKHLYNIASQTQLRFKQINNAISVFKKPDEGESSVLVESGLETITGTVKDSNGEPMPGVSILLKGTNKGTVTELDGSFSIEASPGQILLFSFIGYERKEVQVESNFNLEVVLVEEENSLDEFVVVGYGTVKKKDITGAVSAIESEELKDQPVVSIDQAIAGRMAGVVVSQATGAPGGGASVRIRGAGSLSAGNEPLYVIDGFPVTNDYDQRNNPLNTINPADIDNIQVLKDASATAIYGSRGSNGVVLITTKSGKEGHAKIEFNVSSGFQQVEKILEVLNASEFASYINEARNNAWVNSGPGRSASDPNSNRIQNVMYLIPQGFENPQSLGEGTNWQEEIFRTARMSDYRLNFSGGTEKTRYFVSGGYLEQEGIIINSDLKRYSFRVNVESQMNERVKVGVNITPSYTFSNQSLAEGNWQGGGIIQSAITAGPHLSPYDSEGNYTKITGQGIGTSEVDNPVKIAKEYFHQQKNLRLLGTAFTEVRLIDNLKFKALLGTDIRSFREDIFSSSIINPNSVNLTRPAVGSNNTSQTVNWLSEFTLSYGKTLGKHTFDAVLGYTVQKERLELNQIKL